ncbi:MAG TPA: sugar ABC transporter ATP-binding protein [Verrucomicrobiae bacterium]|nr:sugar ABC transporter ATP-binding protein [Verrucomicrobiae bacterium]
MSFAAASSPLLEARGISKSFPGVRALHHVDLEIRPGEVHAVVGENGAGKSTLMHILAGVFTPDEGILALCGASVSFTSPWAAQEAGIAMVFQERSLAAPLSVAENVFFGRQPVGPLGMINRGQMHRRTQEILAELDINLSSETPVEDLSPAEQQMVEIAKALSIEARVLVLDEPTSALTEAETTTLFRVIRRLRERGAGVVYISHRMAEVFRICDRVTVLRDGEGQGTFRCDEVSEEELIMRMVGRELSFSRSEASRQPASGAAALEVEGLSDDSLLEGISFKAHSGEITAFAGLAGSGRTELAMAIFGARRITAGTIRVEGRSILIRSPSDAIRAGIGYLPEDRKDAGLFLEMNLADNFGAAGLERFGCWWLDDRAMEEQSQMAATRLRLTNPHAVQQLSGGNQQKILLARWLLVRPPIFIVDEPTRGIDVGAKMEVHQLLRELARQGAAIVLISSELPEVLSLADRILVMREGCLAGEIPRAQATEESILRLAALSPSLDSHACA